MKSYLTPLAIILTSLSLTACGGGSSGGSNTPVAVSPPPPPPDTSAPTVTITPSTGTLLSGQILDTSVSATDNVGITSGPTTTCDNGGGFVAGIFEAPIVTTTTTVTCTTTASDAAGNEGSATLTVTVNPDIDGPTVSISPASFSLEAGQTASVAISVDDNSGVIPTPVVTCDNGGIFDVATSTFTAPNTAGTVTCNIQVTDVAGNVTNESFSVTVTPDSSAPAISFETNPITLTSGQTATSVLSVSDNIGVTSGPTVTCDVGTFDVATNTYAAPTVTAQTTANCEATASDAAGNVGTADLAITVNPMPTGVMISGKATFDEVTHNTGSSSLNYSAITQQPIRGATIQLLDSAGALLDASVTDSEGDYSFLVDPNTSVRVRVLAEMVQSSTASWDVSVVDNTNNGGLYSFQGSLATSGTTDTIRNLNAASGWTGSSYTATRVAGPFAIMDPIYDTVQKFSAVDPDVNFPEMRFNWSTLNRPEQGDRTAGQIGTSSYIGGGDVFILGDQNEDTDEYDSHVVIHEWGHYYEDLVSRADSIGGPHGGGDRLDPRVAFGEGWGNAVSGMITEDPFYRDSFGNQQSRGFSINVENNNNPPAGWFNEGSVQSILYDIYDPNNDGADSISLGLGPIHDVLTAASYTGSPWFTTIFLFADEFRSLNPANTAGIDALLSAQSINGTGPNGSGETNNGGLSDSLPVFKTVTVNGGAVNICSNDDAGDFNKLTNRQYISLTVTSSGTHNFRMARTQGATNRDPDFVVFQNGSFVGVAESGDPNVETASNFLAAGQYMIDAYDFNNIGTLLGAPVSPGDACYDFSVTR